MTFIHKIKIRWGTGLLSNLQGHDLGPPEIHISIFFSTSLLPQKTASSYPESLEKDHAQGFSLKVERGEIINHARRQANPRTTPTQVCYLNRC